VCKYEANNQDLNTFIDAKLYLVLYKATTVLYRREKQKKIEKGFIAARLSLWIGLDG
jgi:hypothetical protein